MNPANFDDIRPYYDEEIPAAMKRIVESNFFGLLCTYVYPGRNPEDIRQMKELGVDQITTNKPALTREILFGRK